MNRRKTFTISFLITAAFAIACFFMPTQTTLFWTVVISSMTFLISFVFIEMIGHMNTIGSSDLDNKYRFFEECGISEYHKDFSEIDFNPCISSSNSIKMVLLYSSRFIKNYISALREFVSREGSNIEIILITNNTESCSYRYISEKFGYENQKLAESLGEFIKILQQDVLPSKNEKSTISLYFTELIPTYALYMFKGFAYITLYKMAPQRTNLIPCFRVEKAYDSSFYNFMLNDFNEIKSHQKTHKIDIL